MAIDSVNALLEIIRQHQLLEPGQLNELLPETRRFTDPRALAQHLLKKNCLTPYQVNQIFQGQATGLVLGQYRLLERLGEGGMGQVFKARHQAMGRIVALKVIRKDRLENERAVKRFRREIQMAGQLQHPNVVLAFDADHVGGTHFFAMEYVDGADLSRLVKQTGALPVQVACDYIRQAALGLQHAHERGLVHRDIKPGNLLLSKGEAGLNGRPASSRKGKRTGGGPIKPLIKILDMGLARLDELDEAAASISRDGTVMGTPDYMAPEQAKDSHGVDWRGDIYSLGCTFYFLLTAQVPFPGGSNIEKLLKHQMDTPRPIEQLRPDVPPKVRSILQSMMAKRKEDRIQTAGEVASLLAPFSESGTAVQPAAAVNHVRAGPPPFSAPGAPTVSSSLAPIRNLFIDPDTHRARRLGLVIALVALLGLLGMFVVLMSLVSGLASGFAKPTASVALGTGKQTPKTIPVASTNVKPPAPTPPERRVALEAPVRYLPEGTNNVWVFKLKELLKSPVGMQHENLIKAKLSDHYLLLQNRGIDLYADVERVTYAVYPAGNALSMFALFQGSFDGRKFQEAIDQARPRPVAHRVPRSGGQHYYEFAPAGGESAATFIWLANANSLVICNDQMLITNSLTRTTAKRFPELNDKDVQRQLDSLDDKPALFLVIGGSFAPGGQSLLTNNGIRSITCGFRPGVDLQAAYVLAMRDLDTVQGARPGAADLFKKLVANFDDSGTLSSGVDATSAIVNERDNTITVQGRYTAAQAGALLKR